MKSIKIALLLLSSLPILVAQTDEVWDLVDEQNYELLGGELSDEEEESGDRILPGSFEGVELGMEKQNVQSVLMKSPYFLYRGEPDVSLRPLSREYVIDSEGRDFVDRGLFQFEDDRLVLFALFLNQQKLDYYAIHTHLTDRYGEPDAVHPQYMKWENSRIRILIERPLTIKYSYRNFTDENLTTEVQDIQSRDRFLDLF